MRRAREVTATESFVYLGDNLPILQAMEPESVRLIYIDPPFNTGREQSRTTISVERNERGDRTGFQGVRYQTNKIAEKAFADAFENYLEFLAPRLREAYRILAPEGSMYLHLDYREVHRVKLLMDEIFGEEGFLNEIIWAYDYGGRPRDRWPPKHDNILLYAKNPGRHIFNRDEIERIPYMAPGLVGPEKAARGKLPTDTWWHTIVGTNSKEKTGYPTQKPLGVLKRVIQASSRPGDVVLDFFAGSGTTGEAAQRLGRRFILIDNNPQALQVMLNRFHDAPDVRFIGVEPSAQTALNRQATLFMAKGVADAPRNL